MAKLVFHSDDSFVALGQSGSALTGNDKARLFPLVQSASVNIDSAGARQVSNFLGSTTTGIDDLIKQPSVDIDLIYYLSPYGVNERICGISGSGESGIASFINPIRAYHNNIYFAFNNKEPQEGFTEPRYTGDGYWSDHSFLSVGNCYLTKYSLNFSLNTPVMASMSFVGDNISTAYGIGEDIPLPSRLSNGTAATGVLSLDDMYTGLANGMSVQPEGRTAYNPSVTLPYECQIQLSEIQGGGISIATGHEPVIQSISMNVAIDRTPYYGLGNNYPTTRKASLPLNGDLNVSFLMSGLKAGELDTLTSSETGHYIKFKCVDFKNTGVFITYEIPEARIQSYAYSCDINGIYKCDMKFSFEDFGYAATANPIPDPYVDTFDIYVGGMPMPPTSYARSRLSTITPDGMYANDLSNLASFNSGSSVNSVVVQSDGKIVAVGDFTGYDGVRRGRIVRLNTDGSYDTGFNNTGSGFDGRVRAVTMHTGDKILVGGDFSFYNSTAVARLARLNSDGTLDTGFSTPAITATGTARHSGTYDTNIYCLKVDSSNRIYIGGGFTGVNGSRRQRLARLSTSGTLDTAFTGYQNGRFFEFFTNYSVSGLSGTGTGFLTGVCACHSIGINPSGNVVASAYASQAGSDGSEANVGIFLSSNGMHQAVNGVNFATSVTAIPRTIFALKVGLDHKVLGVGDFNSFRPFSALNSRRRVGVIAFTSTMVHDYNYAFGVSSGVYQRENTLTGATSTPVGLCVLDQPNKSNSTIVGGIFTGSRTIKFNNILRLDESGLIDPTFSVGAGPDGAVRCLSTLPNGNILIGGSFSNHTFNDSDSAQKYKPSGGLINSGYTSGRSGFNGVVLAAKQQTDLKTVYGGAFTTYDGSGANKIVRINTNGAIDTGFNIGSGFNGNVKALLIQTDGKIIVGGEFTGFNGTLCGNIARLTSSGTLDAGFSHGAGFRGSSKSAPAGTYDYSVVNTLAQDVDGRIYVGGLFKNYNGVAGAARNLINLTSGGSHNTSFGMSVGFGDSVRALAIRPNANPLITGTVIIGGDFFSTPHHTHKGGIAEYNSTGGQVTVFNDGIGAFPGAGSSGDGFNGSVRGLAIEPNGDVIVVGQFTTFKSSSTLASGICRLNRSGEKVVGTGALSGSLAGNGFCVKKLSNGNVLVGGSFDTANNTASDNLVEFTSSGTIAQSFDNSFTSGNSIYAIA